MSRESRILAGVLLVTYPTVILGGVSLLSLLVFTDEYAANRPRQVPRPVNPVILSGMLTAQEVIDRLQLVPLTIEGGHFRETYRSPLRHMGHALPAEYGGERNASTAIYYLLKPDTFSAIHRVKSDEVFHFYAGDPVEMLQLWPDGAAKVVLIGNDLAAGQSPQVVVPAGVWQGCRLKSGGRWALMGCTVAPGFDYADFEAAPRAQLLRDFPENATLITTLTHL